MKAENPSALVAMNRPTRNKLVSTQESISIRRMVRRFRLPDWNGSRKRPDPQLNGSTRTYDVADQLRIGKWEKLRKGVESTG
jgi:hypothetical protein